MGTFIFSGLLWPQQPRRLDGKPQILMWILMWKKGKNLVYLYEKLSILSIGGARLIFMNSSKCPTKSLIKKWDVVLSGSCAWRYSFSQLSIKDSRILNGYLICFKEFILRHDVMCTQKNVSHILMFIQLFAANVHIGIFQIYTWCLLCALIASVPMSQK